MAFKTIISNRYTEDLESVLDYITNTLYNHNAADRIYQKSSEIIAAIKVNPHLYPLHHSEVIAKKGYRFANVGNYLLFYRIDEVLRETTIVSLIHGSRNLPNFL
jgi:plasmid stabilization system protein ParE